MKTKKLETLNQGLKRKTNLAKLAMGAVFAISMNAQAAPLFTKGAETFKILNQKGETPTFRILSDSISKQALAVAAIGVINSQPEVKPKLPMTSYIDLKFQTLTLKPQGKDQLALNLKLSGYPVDLEKTVSKSDLLAGKEIDLKYPTTSKDVGLSTVDTSGSLKMHLDKASSTLVLEDVNANLSFSSPLGDDEHEAVRFSGTAKPIE